MEFRDFAQRLYQVTGYDENIPTFTRTLFLSLLPYDKDTLVDISNRTLNAYYTGQCGIARIAKRIISFANPRIFEVFLFQQNKTHELFRTFSDAIMGITTDNACEYVADAFYRILYDAIQPVDRLQGGGGG